MMAFIKIVIALLLLLIPTLSLAAGSCTQTLTKLPTDDVNATVKMVRFICTGDSSDGSIPATVTSTSITTQIIGMYLYTVSAYPTSGGTAPDAADVQIQMGGSDLLGAKGANLIHATLRYDTWPYSTMMSEWRAPIITGALTLAVANQGTASANYTIELILVKW